MKKLLALLFSAAAVLAACAIDDDCDAYCGKKCLDDSHPDDCYKACYKTCAPNDDGTTSAAAETAAGTAATASGGDTTSTP